MPKPISITDHPATIYRLRLRVQIINEELNTHDEPRGLDATIKDFTSLQDVTDLFMNLIIQAQQFQRQNAAGSTPAQDQNES